MKVEVYKGEQGNFNLTNYQATYDQFDWKEVEKVFSWNETGKINMAYECIDRHVNEGKADKIALNYKDNRRKESYTFKDLQEKSNQAANVLKNKANVQKRGSCLHFYASYTRTLFCIFWHLKIGRYCRSFI